MTKGLHLYDILKRPVITEKSTGMADQHNQYVFEVAMNANKIQIAEAVMKIFDVDVIHVRTMVVAPKRGRRYRSYYIRRKIWKKAVVSLPQGQTIGIFHA